jgi:glycosyltransferase involved in cell wall biosynthesis
MKQQKTAIIHYWLVGMRGGEKMLEALLELFPDADIFTHVYKKEALTERITGRRVFTSYINKLPFAARLYQIYMPLMPAALAGFDLREYDLVISSEAGPAKGIVPRPDAYHICYCHSPMRYIWDMYHRYAEDAGFIKRFFMRLLTPRLRLWDVCSANLVDRFITNSRYSAQRIRRYYRREAEVVYGPAEIERYLDNERAPEDFYLYFGQLTYNKRAAIAIDACINLQKKIVVAGAADDGRLAARYRSSSLVTFTGRLSDGEVPRYYARAKALLFPGTEDFGLVPVEAQAAGCPVIAFRAGGALETVIEGSTGLFFDEENAASLAAAIKLFERDESRYQNRDAYRGSAARFSKAAFLERVKKIIEERRQI